MARRRGILERFSSRATAWAGSSWIFALALGVVVLWAVTGPFFGFSDTWQLVINTSTTIVTFLMVFLIQRSQNKDSCAIQLKLNELVAAVQGASNRLINVEDLSEKEVQGLHRHYSRLVELAKAEGEITESHSVEEAAGRHRWKLGQRTRREHERSEGGPQAPSRPAAAHQQNGLAAPTPGGAGPAPERDELAKFLGAADTLLEKVQWHRQQTAEHEARIRQIQEVLACHGFRMRARPAAKPGPRHQSS